MIWVRAVNTKGTCPVCRTDRPVNQDGTLRRHRKVTVWEVAGTVTHREIHVCTGSGLPPLGSWPSHRPHSAPSADDMATSDGLGRR